MQFDNSVKTLVPQNAELRPSSGNHGSFPSHDPSVRGIPSIWDYWPILVRHKWTILSVMLVTIVGGAVLSFSATPIYEAKGQIAINREGAETAGMKNSDGSGNDSADDYMVAMDTQTHVLESDVIAKLVLRKLNLDSNPAFAGKIASPAPSAADASTVDSRAIEPHREAMLVNKFHASLQVSSIPRTRILELRFASSDPNVAAKAVNSLIDTYIEQNYKTRLDATTRTADWLTQQLSELQLKVEESQEKLVRYQKEHGILGIDEKENIITSKLNELNKELTAAEADRMQKESIYRMAGSGDPELLSSLDPSSPLIKLRAQEEDLHRQIAQASVHFTPSYPKLQELNGELDAVQTDIKTEISRLSIKYKKDYLAALEHEKLLRGSLENQKTDANQLNESAIEYSLLKRDVDSNRQLYEGLLQKLKEAGVMTGLRSSNVRIVDPASTPTSPSSPNIPRNLLLSVLMGLAGGVALAFVLESRDDAVHSLEQAEMISGLPSLAIVPLETPSNRLLPASRRLPKTPAALATALQPKSEIAEAYRGLRPSNLLSSMGKSAKVLMVTSPLPQEGKTTTSVNLSIALSQKGARVLLIEGDMRRASISQIFELKSNGGLSTVLANSLDVHTALQSVPGLPNLTVLPAGPVALYPSEMLASAHMRDLLASMRQEFDHIIIDTPPVLSVTDAALLSAYADSTLLVIRSGSTNKAALRRARDVLAQVDARVLGVILNAADFMDPDRYYYGDRYGGYHERASAHTASLD